MEKILEKESFQEFLEDLIKQYKVIGPVRKGGGTSTYSYTTFDYVESVEDLEMDYTSSMLTHKSIYFPDNEPVYEYEVKNNRVEIRDLMEIWSGERVIVGMHPCDITAILHLDKVFLEEAFEDPYYKDKRSKTIIIGLTCSKVKASCFCNIVGSGPDIETGYDLLMTDIGDSYFIKVGSEVGEGIVSKDYFRNANEEDRKRRSDEIEKVAKQLPAKLDMDKILDVMPEKYNDGLWKEYSDRCLTCGACNMVCPTCHCFVINDKTNSDRTKGTRFLSWDSCHFERFARIAGSNIRGEKGSRYKHRMYDKFYYDVKRYGTVFCVGCGRCLEFCPSHIDIRSILRKLEA